jgi:cytochrome c nitrite reductase small subunit
MILWVVVLLSLAIAIGVGLYTTGFTDYLGNNPTTCNNCHVMDAVYEGWFHAGHKNAATCSDCHTLHAWIPKYLVKAESGYHHVTAFISGNIPHAIRAKESSRKIVQENCIRCHTATVAGIPEGPPNWEQAGGRYCFDCHRTVSHGERGISILPSQHTESNR